MRRDFVAAAALAALSFSVVAAQAGGFASRDQSTVGEGMSFAGEGTTDMGLSAMFWNPAAVTQTKGWGAEAHVSFTFPNATIATNPALTTPALLSLCPTAGCPPTSNVLNDRVFPAFYGAYQINPSWYVGLAVNSPFGVKSTIPDIASSTGTVLDSSPMSQLASGEKISTIDVNPVVGWKINNTVSVGAGPQFLWLRNDFSRDLFAIPGFGANLDSPINLQARGFGVGFTAGVTWTPTPATEVALGYRSQVRMGLSGTQFFTPNAALAIQPSFAAFNGATIGVTSNITLPDQVNLGVRQGVTDKLALLGTIEWTNWSVLQNTQYVFTGGPAPGTVAQNIFYSYRDGWFFSAGAEYAVLSNTTLRAGIGYEQSPVNGTLGLITVPGANATSLSVGVSHKFTDRLTFDLAYSHTWMDTQQFNVGAGNPQQTQFITLIPGVFNSWGGSATGSNDVVSFAIRYAFAEAPPPPPLITKAK